MNFLPRCRLSYSKIVQTTQERHRHPVTAHLSRRQPYVPSGHADVSPWPQPRSGLMFLCSYVLLFPALAANQVSLRRQPLCLLRPPGRKSVAVRRAAALCVSYENLCSYVPAVSGKHKRYILCSYVLMFFCFPR